MKEGDGVAPNICFFGKAGILMEEYGNLTSGREGARDKDLTMSGGLVCNRGYDASWVTESGIS